MRFNVLAQHHLPESTSAQHFQQLELFETVYIVLIGLALENDFALGFDLIILFDALGVEEERFDGMYFFDVFADLVDGGGVLFQWQIVIVV